MADLSQNPQQIAKSANHMLNQQTLRHPERTKLVKRFSQKTYFFIPRNRTNQPVFESSLPHVTQQQPVSQKPMVGEQEQFRTPEKKNAFEHKMTSTAGTTGQLNSVKRFKLILKWQLRRDRFSRKLYYFRPRRPLKYPWNKWEV